MKSTDLKESIKRNVETLLIYNNKLTVEVERRNRQIDLLKEQLQAAQAHSQLHRKLPHSTLLCERLALFLRDIQEARVLERENQQLNHQLAARTQQLENTIAQNEGALKQVILVSQLKEQIACYEDSVYSLRAEADAVKLSVIDLCSKAKLVKPNNDRRPDKKKESFYRDSIKEMQNEIRRLQRDIAAKKDRKGGSDCWKIIQSLEEYSVYLPAEKKEVLERYLKMVGGSERQKCALRCKIKEIEEEAGDEVGMLQQEEHLERLHRQIMQLREWQKELLEEHRRLSSQLQELQQ